MLSNVFWLLNKFVVVEDNDTENEAKHQCEEFQKDFGKIAIE
jgi:hypothetical protein